MNDAATGVGLLMNHCSPFLPTRTSWTCVAFIALMREGKLGGKTKILSVAIYIFDLNSYRNSL